MSSESNASATTAQHHASAVTPGSPKPGDSQWKDNNPKAAFGAAKVGIDYLSFPVLLEQAIGMMAGGYKYGAHNYLVAGPSVMTYIAAAFRHMAAYVGGEEYDPHAGPGVKVHHLVAAQNCLHVVRAAQIQGIAFDDRPPKMPPGFIESLADSVAALQRNNPDPVARYLADGKRGPGRIIGESPSGTKTSAPNEPRPMTDAEAQALFDSLELNTPAQDQASRERDHEALQPPARDFVPWAAQPSPPPPDRAAFVPCDGCDGHECDDGCAYPNSIGASRSDRPQTSRLKTGKAATPFVGIKSKPDR